MIFEPVSAYLACGYQLKYATTPWEKAGASALRHKVFCEEQRLFAGDDRDTIDAVATTIVAIAMMGVAADEVVGTVRIHEATPGVWWGSRLAVSAPYRRLGMLGAPLIRLAVSSAHARGCTQFFAHVQSQNAPLFRRLHWETLDVVDLHGMPHHRMQADLAHYPPFTTPETGFLALRKAA